MKGRKFCRGCADIGGRGKGEKDLTCSGEVEGEEERYVRGKDGRETDNEEG